MFTVLAQSDCFLPSCPGCQKSADTEACCRVEEVKAEAGTGLMDTCSRVSAFSFRPKFQTGAEEGPTGACGSSGWERCE